jgi:oligopeptide transport system ATP-binding protein
MRQRVMIAIGLLCEPDLLIADEPTTALDVTVQAQITELVGELRQQRQMAIILITHDMAAVAEISDRIIVMYAGEAVETGSVEDIFYRPHHPYTRGLLASVPRLDRVSDEELQAIPGNPPNLQDLPSGCRFRDRCSQAMEECLQRPPLWTTGGGRTSRCFLPMEGGYIAAAEGPNEPGEPVETAEVRDASAAGPGDKRREGAA